MTPVQRNDPVSGVAFLAVLDAFMLATRPDPQTSDLIRFLKRGAKRGAPELVISTRDWLGERPESSLGTLEKVVARLNGLFDDFFSGHRALAESLLEGVGVDRDELRMALPVYPIDETRALRWERTGKVGSWRSGIPRLLESAAGMAPDARVYLDVGAFEVGLLRGLDDLRALASMNALEYGTGSIPLDLLERWWKAYEKGFTGIFEEGVLIGAITMLPIDGPTHDRLLAGTCRERDIAPDMIESLSTGPVDRWYGLNAILRPEYRKTSAFHKLLVGTVRAWLRPSVSRFPATILAESFPGLHGLPGGGAKLLHDLDFVSLGLVSADGWPIWRGRCDSAEDAIARMRKTPAGAKPH